MWVDHHPKLYSARGTMTSRWFNWSCEPITRASPTPWTNPGSGAASQGNGAVGKEQDLSITKGCRPLGLRVPHVEYELMKIEKDHHKYKLFVGQRPSDGKSPVTPDDRPTSFQPALIKCGPARSNNAYYGYQVHVAEQQVQEQNSNSAPNRLQLSLLLTTTATLLTLFYAVLCWNNWHRWKQGKFPCSDIANTGKWMIYSVALRKLYLTYNFR